MTIALIANALLGFFLISVVVTLLASAITRSRADQRFALVTRHRQPRGYRSERRSAARPRSSWAARPDAS